MWSIMVTDDEPKIRRGLCKFIENSNLPLFICSQAADGMEALQLLEQKRPDIVLLDICMPHMDGLAFLAEAKKKDIKSKFIVITGFDDFSFAQQTVSLRAFAYLLKPIDETELLSHLCAAISDLEAELNEKEKNKEALVLFERNQRLTKKTSDQNANEREKPIPEEIKDYIDMHYKNAELSLSTISGALNISQPYISRLMKSAFSTTFVGYLTNKRISEAVSLMSNPENKLSWISKEVGYSNQHYFSTVFKKHTGMSPSVYRENEL